MSVVSTTILLNGRAIDPEWPLLSIDVRTEINRIPTATLEFLDGDVMKGTFPLSEESALGLGQALEIRLGYEGEPTDQTVFKGVIVRHGLDVQSASSRLIVEAKDTAVAMTLRRRTAVYRQMSDSDIMKRLVQSAGLRATVATTSIQHQELTQYACTDWDFVVTRADAMGLLVAVKEGVVSVAKPTLGAPPRLRLVFGIDEIYGFTMEADASSQVPDVKTFGWAVKERRTQTGKAMPFALAQGNWNARNVAKSLNATDLTLSQSGNLVKGELDGWASAKLLRSRLAFLRGRLSIVGTAAASLLDVMELERVGERFAGKTLVTGVAHRVSEDGWVTDVQFGLSPETLTADDAVWEPPASGLIPPVMALQIGVVVDFVDDPETALRVRVALPTQGDGIEVWARLATPDAGNHRGFFFRPERDDEVIVGFLNNDPRSAVIIGSLFGPKNAQPQLFGKPTKDNPKKGIVTRSGTTISFLDEDKPQVWIETAAHNKVCLSDKDKRIAVTDQHGNTLTLDDTGITLKSSKDITIESQGGVTIKATGNVAIQGQKVDVK